jgi:hypothetical protein
MTDDLSMRRNVIGGETAPDDYDVIWDELTIGRIFKQVGAGTALIRWPDATKMFERS